MAHSDKVKKYMKQHPGVSLGAASKAVATGKEEPKSAKKRSYSCLDCKKV